MFISFYKNSVYLFMSNSVCLNLFLSAYIFYLFISVYIFLLYLCISVYVQFCLLISVFICLPLSVDACVCLSLCLCVCVCLCCLPDDLDDNRHCTRCSKYDNEHDSESNWKRTFPCKYTNSLDYPPQKSIEKDLDSA